MARSEVIDDIGAAFREEKKSGERLISRLRIMVVVAASFTLVLDPGGFYRYTAAWSLMVVYSAVVYILLKKDIFPRYFGYMTLLADSVAISGYLAILSFTKTSYTGAFNEPLFAILYLISVSGVVKYDYRYSVFSLVICSCVMLFLALVDREIHGMALQKALIAEKFMMLGIFSMISFIFCGLFNKVVISEHRLKSRHIHEISTILTLGRDIATKRKLKRILSRVTAETKDILESDICYIALRNQATGLIDNAIINGNISQIAPVLPEGGIEASLVAKASPLMINSPGRLNELFPGEKAGHLAGENAVTVLGVPLALQGRTIGALIAARRTHREYTKHDQILLKTISQHAGLLIQNTMLLEELKTPEPPAVRCRFEDICGESPRMLELYSLIEKAARTNITVLIRGESGTGKELVAKALHRLSGKNTPFIKINCAAIPETLLESELFGHEKGAFTGASRQKKGKFELADGGTLFLDEIGDMTPAIQIKLLRALQENEFERLGGENTIRVNVRLITATNQKLEDKIAQGSFREDLFYRINAFPLHVPSLAERPMDIPILTMHFLERELVSSGKKMVLSPPAMNYLTKRHWKGNVRELENFIRRLVVIAEKETITEKDLLSIEETPRVADSELSDYIRKTISTGCCLTEQIENIERTFIECALTKANGSGREASKILNIPKSSLFYRINKYEINLQ